MNIDWRSCLLASICEDDIGGSAPSVDDLPSRYVCIKCSKSDGSTVEEDKGSIKVSSSSPSSFSSLSLMGHTLHACKIYLHGSGSDEFRIITAPSF